MAVRTKALSLLSPASAFGPTPGEEDLAAIHRLCLEPVPAESLYVRRMALANTRLDRTYERFTPAVLQRLAETLPGKSLLISHNTRELATGLFYRADVQRAPDGESELVAYFYLPVIPANEEVRQLIDAGVIRHVSIGFRYDQRLCSVCDMDYWSCPHLPGDTTDGGQLVTFVYGGDLWKFESREGSLVYLGAQRDAEIIKELPAGTTPSFAGYPGRDAERGGSPMGGENEKALARIKELEAELKTVSERLLTLPKLEEERDRLKAECATLREQLQSAQATAARAPGRGNQGAH